MPEHIGIVGAISRGDQGYLGAISWYAQQKIEYELELTEKEIEHMRKEL